MVHRNAHMRRYLREIQNGLPCSGRQKRRILEKIENTIAAYQSDNPNADYFEIVARFGEPQQIVSSYVDEMATDEVLRDLQIRKRVVRIIACVAAAVVLLWAGAVAIAVIDSHRSVNGSGDITVITGERTEFTEGGVQK